MDGTLPLATTPRSATKIAGTHNFDFGGAPQPQGLLLRSKFLSFQVCPSTPVSVELQPTVLICQQESQPLRQLFREAIRRGRSAYSRDYNREGEVWHSGSSATKLMARARVLVWVGAHISRAAFL